MIDLRGTLHIAEVTSRFDSTEAFVEKVESFGFSIEQKVCACQARYPVLTKR